MTEPVFIKTPSGDEIVVLQRRDYERLVALTTPPDPKADGEDRDGDASDLAHALAAKRDWEAAGRPTVPLAALRHVRAGDSYLRAFRKVRGLTQADLSARTGVAQGFLSEIELGRKSAAPATLAKIAAALDMHVGLLQPDAPAGTAR